MSYRKREYFRQEKGARESMYYATNIKEKYGITGKKTL